MSLTIRLRFFVSFVVNLPPLIQKMTKGYSYGAINYRYNTRRLKEGEKPTLTEKRGQYLLELSKYYNLPISAHLIDRLMQDRLLVEEMRLMLVEQQQKKEQEALEIKKKLLGLKEK